MLTLKNNIAVIIITRRKGLLKMDIKTIEELARLKAAFKLLKAVIEESEAKSKFSDGSPYKDLEVNRKDLEYVFLVAGVSDHEVDVIDLDRED